MLSYLVTLAVRHRLVCFGFVVLTLLTQRIDGSGYAGQGNVTPLFWILLAGGVQVRALRDGLFGPPVPLSASAGACLAYVLKAACLGIFSLVAWTVIVINVLPRLMFTGRLDLHFIAGTVSTAMMLSAVLALAGTWPLAALAPAGRSLSAALARGLRSCLATGLRIVPVLVVSQLAYGALVHIQARLPDHDLGGGIGIGMPNIAGLLLLLLAGLLQAAVVAYVALLLAKAYRMQTAPAAGPVPVPVPAAKPAAIVPSLDIGSDAAPSA